MFGKLFSSMYEGSLHGNWEAIVTLQQMVILCDRDGIVEMTLRALSARTSIPFEILEKGVEILEAPDPHSRSDVEDGRRIVRIDPARPWGWRIVNHAKYRALRDPDAVREQTRDRVRRHRENKKGAGDGNASVTDCNGEKRHTETDTETETETEKRKPRGKRSSNGKGKAKTPRLEVVGSMQSDDDYTQQLTGEG